MVGIFLLVAAALSVYVLRFDYILQFTHNFHWYALVAFVVIDLILGFEVILTAALRLREKTLVQAAGLWAFLMTAAIVGDVFLRLQLPAGYPTVSVWNSFAYLLLGINGNPVPFAVPALLAIYLVAAILALLPLNSTWFDWASLPKPKTILALVLVAVIVMGLRPAFLLYNSQFAMASSGRPSASSTSTEMIVPPKQHLPLPYDSSNRTVFLLLVAESNVMMPDNFNNTHYGQLTVYVPANWTLRLTFVNEEGIQHNAVLIQPNVTSPTADPIQDGAVLAQIPRDAFAGGFMATGESGSAVVRNLAPGTY
jgi:sulfocyanin